MASLPLSEPGGPANAEVMALAMAIFFVLLLVASIAGLTADSRDSADWKPTDGGFRSA
jgi:hypothetical protein